MVQLYASLAFPTHGNALTMLKIRLGRREETELHVIVKNVYTIHEVCRTRQNFDRALTVRAYVDI